MEDLLFPPRTTDMARTTTLYLDAVEGLVKIAKLQYGRVVAAAMAIPVGPTPPGFDKDAIHTALLADAAAFVGTVEKLRKTVQHLRGDPDLRIAKRVFEAAVSRFDDARDHLEHIDNAIPTIAGMEEAEGYFGSVSWLRTVAQDGLAAFFFMPGTILPNAVSAPVTIPSAPFLAGIVEISIQVGGRPYILTTAHEAVRRLEHRLREHSKRQLLLGLATGIRRKIQRDRSLTQ